MYQSVPIVGSGGGRCIWTGCWGTRGRGRVDGDIASVPGFRPPKWSPNTSNTGAGDQAIQLYPSRSLLSESGAILVQGVIFFPRKLVNEQFFCPVSFCL